jgi:predicted nuclease with RNAse H fold
MNRYAGLSLLGGKSDRTCLALIEYYPRHNKIFLHQIYENVTGTKEASADKVLIETIKSFEPDLKMVGLDAPLQFPKCVGCKLRCPGFEECKEPEVKWMREEYWDAAKTKKNLKWFTPYTQRAVEIYLQRHLEQPYFMHEALGANMAPLTARASFIQRRFQLPFVEVFPEISFIRLGKWLGLGAEHFETQGRAFERDYARQAFINALVERKMIFLYQQDIQRLIDNSDAFDAFLCGLTAYLMDMGKCEPRPKGFPKTESWIAIPKT